MNEIIKIEERDGLGRDVFYLFVSKFSDLPVKFDLSSSGFALFVACDSASISVDEIGDWSDKMIDAGIASISTWGDGCERMHDIFDEVFIGRQVAENRSYPHIMTTWHSKDTLEEALWYSLNCAFAVDELSDSCKSNLIVAVSNKEWDVYLHNCLSNIDKFNQDYLEKE